MSPEQLAEGAYRKYAETTDGKNFMGGDMPMFWMLPESVQAAWVAAADYAFKQGVKHANTQHRALLKQLEKEFWP